MKSLHQSLKDNPFQISSPNYSRTIATRQAEDEEDEEDEQDEKIQETEDEEMDDEEDDDSEGEEEDERTGVECQHVRNCIVG